MYINVFAVCINEFMHAICKPEWYSELLSIQLTIHSWHDNSWMRHMQPRISFAMVTLLLVLATRKWLITRFQPPNHKPQPKDSTMNVPQTYWRTSASTRSTTIGVFANRSSTRFAAIHASINHARQHRQLLMLITSVPFSLEA